MSIEFIGENEYVADSRQIVHYLLTFIIECNARINMYKEKQLL